MPQTYLLELAIIEELARVDACTFDELAPSCPVILGPKSCTPWTGSRAKAPSSNIGLRSSAFSNSHLVDPPRRVYDLQDPSCHAHL